jgi:outer membrane protein assembly factor BamD
VEEANKKIDELRLKLETKEYNNAKLYYLTENYKAAIFAFDNLLKDYPSSNYKEESMYLSLRAAYLYATNSVEIKKKDRLTACNDRYLNLLDNFPQSRYLRDAEKIYVKVKSELNAMTTPVVTGTN